MHFLPRIPKFFDLFEKLSAIVGEAAVILDESDIMPKKKLLSHLAKIRLLEELADKLCHKIYNESDSTFLTPIDREDIQTLTKSLDNIIDHSENVLSNVVLYNVNLKTREFRKFTKLVRECALKVKLLIACLRSKNRDAQKMRKLIIQIHTFENEGDILLRQSMKSLFSNHKKAIEIIKWKDIYENMEAILDECEDTADVVETIVLKNF